MSIEGIIVWNVSHCLLHSKFDLRQDLLFYVEIMRPGKLLKFMGFMTNASENTEMPMSGNTLPIYSISCL